MNFKSSPIGHEISCVMKGINKSILNNHKKIKEKIISKLKKEKFGILNISEYEFSPQGFTLIILLSESHLAIHTYPEHNSLYFNMYSCRSENDSEKTYKFVLKLLKPKEINEYNNSKVKII